MVTVYVDEETFWNIVQLNEPFDAVLMPDEYEHIAISVPVDKVYSTSEEGIVNVIGYR